MPYIKEEKQQVDTFKDVEWVEQAHTRCDHEWQPAGYDAVNARQEFVCAKCWAGEARSTIGQQ